MKKQIATGTNGTNGTIGTNGTMERIFKSFTKWNDRNALLLSVYHLFIIFYLFIVPLAFRYPGAERMLTKLNKSFRSTFGTRNNPFRFSDGTERQTKITNS